MLFIFKIPEHTPGQLLEHKLHKFSKSKKRDLNSEYRHDCFVNSTREDERYTPQTFLETGDNWILWETVSDPDFAPTQTEKQSAAGQVSHPDECCHHYSSNYKLCGQKNLFCPNVTFAPVIESGGK